MYQMNKETLIKVFELGKKYNFSIEVTTKLLLEVDRLTEKELLDLDYVEDRLETHYEIWQSNLSK
jgi:NADPH-dependent 7-cyano-7-deazaguanine reductase QueF-like protein